MEGALGRVIGVLMVFVFLAALVCGCLAAALVGLATLDWGRLWARGPLARMAERTVSSELPLAPGEELQVRNEVGQVQVRGAQTDRVRLEATLRARVPPGGDPQTLLGQVQIDLRRVDRGAWLGVSLPRKGPEESLSVRLEIVVPAEVALSIESNVGTLAIAGVTGALKVRNNVGDVELRQVELAAGSDLSTGVGSIRAVAALPSAGEIRFSTEVGRIELRLPADAAFLLEAETGVGKIQCGFELRGSREDKGPGERLAGSVGQEPQVLLRLRAQTGDIVLQPR